MNLLDVRPQLPSDDSSDLPERDTVQIGNLEQRRSAIPELAYRSYVVVRQLRHAVPDAFRVALPFPAISHVVDLRSLVHMVGVYAGNIVAMMTSILPRQYVSAQLQHQGDSVGINRLSSQPHYPPAVSVLPRSPFPTFIRRSYIDSAPILISKFFRKLLVHGRSSLHVGVYHKC